MKFIQLGKSFSWGWHLRLFGIGLPYPRLNTNISKIWKRRFGGLTKLELEQLIDAQCHDLVGKKINWDNPRTFNDKLNWLKVNYHNPVMTVCADKVKAREYFVDKFSERGNHLVKQLGVYDSFDQIDLKAFPKSFVLKSNWGSGAQIIVRDKDAMNIAKMRRTVNKWMRPKSNHYYSFFEWGYKDIVPKIVAEEYLDFRYKLEFFCFNGEPRFFWIVLDDKTKNTKANFYNLDWTQFQLTNHYPNFSAQISKPSEYDEMVSVAKKLSSGFPFVRCDFYVTDDGYRFSEMTFYHWAGYCEFSDETYNLAWGDMIKLPIPV